MLHDPLTLVPQRFGLREILAALGIVSSVYLLSQTVDAQIRLVAPTLWFVLVLGMIQMLFGKSRVLVSMLVGPFVFLLAAYINPMFDGRIRLQSITLQDLFRLTSCGMIVGYLGGTLFREMFQVADRWQGERQQKVYAVPRRFGTSTILIATTVFAIVFAAMEYARVRPWQLFFFTSFVATVSLSQAIVNRNPRWASMLAGAVFLPLSQVLFGSLSSRRLELPQLRLDDPRELTMQLVFFAVVGLLVGYLGGTLIAGVFLVSDYVARVLLRGRRLSATIPDTNEEPLPSGTLTLLAERAAANRRQATL